jgi:serine/threonine protein kinase
MGVVLFILINGYPPFEQAHITDRWFKPIAVGDYNKFWKYHLGCAISNDKQCCDLIQKMLAYDPQDRITIAQIKKHPWFNAKYFEGKQLVRALRHRHREMEQKRRKDARKIKDLNTSNHETRPIPGSENIVIKVFPEFETESIFDTYTTVHPFKFVNAMSDILALKFSGTSTLNATFTALDCRLKMMEQQMAPPIDDEYDEDNSNNNNSRILTTQEEQFASSTTTTETGKLREVAFQVEWWQSREFYIDPQLNKDLQTDNQDVNDEMEHSHAIRELIFCVRIRRIEGSIAKWPQIRKMFLKKCGPLLTGLPQWALDKRTENLENNGINDPFEAALKRYDMQEEVDDYDDWNFENLQQMA